MNILVLTGSPRRGGNTEAMADAFAESARAEGNKVTILKASEMDISGCLACEHCTTNDGECVQKDDMDLVFAALDLADVVVFASPIYFYGLPSQMLAIINRFNARQNTGFDSKQSALMLTSSSPDVYSAAIGQYYGVIRYLGWTDIGIVTISSNREKGAITSSPRLQLAIDLAKNIHNSEEN